MLSIQCHCRLCMSDSSEVCAKWNVIDIFEKGSRRVETSAFSTAFLVFSRGMNLLVVSLVEELMITPGGSCLDRLEKVGRSFCPTSSIASCLPRLKMASVMVRNVIPDSVRILHKAQTCNPPNNKTARPLLGVLIAKRTQNNESSGYR